MKNYFIYIMTSRTGTLYTAVTNNLERRVVEHQHGEIKGFSKKYRCIRLVYFETYVNIRNAILREKEIKSWRRSKKIDLIKTINPHWEDLSKPESRLYL